MQTLRSIAVLTAVGGVGGIVILRRKHLDEIAGSPYFREAFKILRAHPGTVINCEQSRFSYVECMHGGSHFAGAVTLMGEPIKQLGFDPVDENNWCDGARAKFHVRVKGPKDTGCDSIQSKRH